MTNTFYSVSKSNERYTPSYIVEPIREFLNGIELDPASCHTANDKYIHADRFFDEFQDGLKQEWKAISVFCNPPYGKMQNGTSRAGLFLRKAISEYGNERAREIIMLLNANTSEVWFQRAYKFPICFISHRIKFHGGDRQPTKGSCLVYLGLEKRTIDFAKHFRNLGQTMIRIE